MISLYLLRHAIAEPRETFKGPDEERPLTAEGIAKMEKAAKGIANLEERLDAILSSPAKRALETACIVARELGCENVLQELSALAPNASPKKLLGALGRFDDNRHVMLVGHEPDLGRLIALLVGAPAPVTELKKGSLCKLELTAPAAASGRIVWLLQPRALRALRK